MVANATSLDRQFPCVPVAPPPVDDRRAAPPRRIGPGGANSAAPPPPPAAPERKSSVPQHAKGPKAAEIEAALDKRALDTARETLAKLAADSDQIGLAQQAVDAAQAKAERTAVLNVNAQREDGAAKHKIMQDAEAAWSELQRNLRESQDASRGDDPGKVAALEQARAEAVRAMRSFDESKANFKRAMDMLRAVAGVRERPDNDPNAAATTKYPALVIAEGRFRRAVDRLHPIKPSEAYSVQFKKAAIEWHHAWRVACDNAENGNDIALRKACAEGLRQTDQEVQYATAEVEAWKNH